METKREPTKISNSALLSEIAAIKALLPKIKTEEYNPDLEFFYRFERQQAENKKYKQRR